jgi:enoyl-CoA hydratase/carnithine racemase
MTGQVQVNRAGSIAQITFDNQDKRNAMTLAMWQQLGQAIRALEFEDGVRAILLRGAGPDAFVSGADISELDPALHGNHADQTYEGATKHALDAIRISTKPTIAMIHGFCFGAGVAIATACDLRYAKDDAKFSIPAAKLGFGYAVHLVADLLNVVGPTRAKEMLIVARRYDAHEAEAIGLVHKVFAAPEFEDQVLDLACDISEHAPLTMRAAKVAIAALGEHKPSSAIQDADRAVQSCFNSQDATEGRAAFAEKRKPSFTGH